MSSIGNYFALGILLIVSIMFFKNRYFLKTASKYFRVCLIFTFLNTLTDSFRAEAIRLGNLPPIYVRIFVTLDLLLSLLTTSLLILYLISKITEHSVKERSDFLRGKIIIGALYCVFCVVILLNLPFGYIFSVTESGEYIKGALHILPYIFLIPQGLMAVICSLVHKKTLSKNAKHSLFFVLPIIIFATAAELIYDGASAFVLAIALMELVFFLNFQNRRISTNTLTGLNDGRSFYVEVEKRIKARKPFKAYLIKLSNIGSVKANHGHRVGDELLYQFAFMLSKLGIGTPFHMYGNTFALSLPYSEETDEKETEALLEHLDRKISYKGKDFALYYTLAEHVWQDEASADVFYEKLEYAASSARELKKKYARYTIDLEVTRLRRKYLINRMQTVSEAEGFEVWFQPIFSNKKMTFSSMEVLLRLREKNGTLISPAEFIPLAESTGQIFPMTLFVIESTCKALANTPELDGMRASINLPVIQLVDPNFETELNEIVDSYGIPHERLSFEFTERVAIDDLDAAEKNMRRLAESGYSFYLDDFGVGYSNFNCILRLPLKTVKLDMSLTSTIDGTQNNIVCILTDLIHDMGLNVVAEGAETLEQVEYLRSYGVDGIQGYYFAKPMPLAQLKKFIEAQPKQKD